jgi:hypothetical protein
MAVTILENGWISDSFVMGEEPLIYSDAIVMKEAEYNLLTEEEIAQMKQARYDNWLVIINTPSEEPPPEAPEEILPPEEPPIV